MIHLWRAFMFPWLWAWHHGHTQGRGVFQAVWGLTWHSCIGMLMLPLALLCLSLAWLLSTCTAQRRLTAVEVTQGEVLFDRALLMRTRVAQTGRLLRAIHRINGGRPFVCLNVVYPGVFPMDTRTWLHELTHVWQHTWMGPWYMVFALAAQWRAGLWALWRTGKFDDAAAYACDFSQLDLLGADGCQRYVLNPEQQAEAVAAFWQTLHSEQVACTQAQARLNTFVPRLLGLS